MGSTRLGSSTLKPLTIFAALTLLVLPFSESTAQSPLGLQAIEVQDLSAPSRQQVQRPRRFVQVFRIGEAEQCSAEEEISVSENAEREAVDHEFGDEQKELAADEDTRSRATRSHLQQLTKPVQQIQLSAGINRTEVPDNQAASLIQTNDATLIANSGTISMPQRYTVCITHRPLYYEDANLERCGRGHGVWQNAYSGFKFLSSTLLLSYKMGRQCPVVEVRSRGDCKTCQSFPSTIKTVRETPLSGRGLLNEMAALAGFSFLLL